MTPFGNSDSSRGMGMRMGMGQGRGQGRATGAGRGRMGGFGAGPGGNCLCPNCGKAIPHQRGVPCNQIQCPDCNTPMIRQ